MSTEELSQSLQWIRGFVQSSANLGEASTSTSYPIITRLDLTPSSEAKQRAPSTLSSDSLDHPEPLEMANYKLPLRSWQHLTLTNKIYAYSTFN